MSSHTMEDNIPEKVLKFETFVNDQLKPDLRFVLEARDKVYSEIAEFLALKNSILAIQARFVFGHITSLQLNQALFLCNICVFFRLILPFGNLLFIHGSTNTTDARSQIFPVAFRRF